MVHAKSTEASFLMGAGKGCHGYLDGWFQWRFVQFEARLAVGVAFIFYGGHVCGCALNGWLHDYGDTCRSQKKRNGRC